MKLLFVIGLFVAFIATVIGAPKKGTIANECLLPQDAGHCTGYYPAYYYNSKTKKCELFDYTGCDGNTNRFSTKAACESRCL